jgi:hypothetical protein
MIVESRRLVILRNIVRSFSVLVVFGLMAATAPLFAQSAATGIRGKVADPTGAVIPNAIVTVTTPSGKKVATGKSSSTGSYEVTGIPAGIYDVDITEQGFTPFHGEGIRVLPDHIASVNAILAIAVQQQQVHVHAEEHEVSTSPTSNVSSLDIKGNALNALSDDPDNLQNELDALAGPGAGPNGAQIYIDGFSGGQLPPKSDIREIRINSNPFSAEYQRLGYGRIEIFTKPGTGHWHGSYHTMGNYSAFNAQNPILNANLQPGQTANIQEPSYYAYMMFGNLSGPVHKGMDFNLNVFARHDASQAIIDALNPALNGSSNLSTLNETYATPSTHFFIGPQTSFSVGKNNTFTVRYAFFRAHNTNSGVGGTVLPEQAINSTFSDSTVQLGDSIIMGNHLVDDLAVQIHHSNSSSSAISSLPSVTLTQGFSTGGNSSQSSHSTSNNVDLHDYFTASYGSHSISFGGRMRTFNTNSYSTSGSNGSYFFSNNQQYIAGTPTQYSYTKINNPNSSAFLIDTALFYQDDWNVNRRLEFSYGVRWESQNDVNDHSDWAPRISLAYALDGGAKKKAKTVLRAGYGWFYTPFHISEYLNTVRFNYSTTVAPNEQQFTITNPGFYNPNQTTPIDSGSSGANASAPTYYTVDPHFHVANDMEAAIGIDRQLAKNITSNVTYLYTQGVHQYLTNNLGALPNVNVNPQTHTYTGPVGAPTQNIYQYQSGGIYKENQIIATIHAYFKALTLFSYYSYSDAKADTSGTGYHPTVASNPGIDYGRANFDVHSRFLLLATIQAPWRLTFAPIFYASSGSPFNITTGNDLTGNNFYNARPTYAASCNEPNTIKTPYGCLDAVPVGTGADPAGLNEKIIPYNLGTGPSNYGLNLRVSKVIGFGPKIKGGGGGGFHGHGRGLGGRGLSGNSGPIGKFNATVPRKYTLTLAAFGTNLLNHQNLAAPSGTIGLTPVAQNDPTACSTSEYVTTNTAGTQECATRFFLKSQSLAGGFFSRNTSGNRSIFFEATVNF